MELLMRNEDSKINNYYSYQFDRNLHNTGTNYHMPSGNLFLRNFSTTNNKCEMPFMIPSQIQNNIRKKFENFTNYINRKKNFMKYSMNHWNKIKTSHPNFITQHSKNNSTINNPIASYLIGGFVGSKSQMNNGKHNLSYDLGGVIFKILNDCKYGKSCEKTKDEKKFEINKFVKKPKSFVKNSEKSFEYCDILKFDSLIISESQNSNAICNQDKSKNCTRQNFDPPSSVREIKKEKPTNLSYINLDNLASTCTPSPTFKANKINENPANLFEEHIDQISMDINKTEVLQDNLLDYTENYSRNIGKTETSCNPTDDNIQDITNEKSYINAKNMNTEQLASGNTKSDLNSAISCTFSFNSLSKKRMRLCSECSIESTDSESFIVFDDKCDSSFELQSSYLQESENDDSDFGTEDDDYDEEEEEEEEDYEGQDQDGDEENEYECGEVEEKKERNENDDDSIDNESDFCCTKDSDESDIVLEDKEVAEANARWARSYENVSDELDETERKVRFNEKVAVHRIIAWDYAYRAARIGPWEQMVRDRNRFRERIHRLGLTISPVLLQSHREKIYLKFYV